LSTQPKAWIQHASKPIFDSGSEHQPTCLIDIIKRHKAFESGVYGVFALRHIQQKTLKNHCFLLRFTHS
jgi:hypothetical protein